MSRITPMKGFDVLTWGVEAVYADGKVKYVFCKLAASAPTIHRRDGDEIMFNSGKGGSMIDGTDPEFCNLEFAIARALHACGAADIIAEIYHDNEDDEAIHRLRAFLQCRSEEERRPIEDLPNRPNAVRRAPERKNLGFSIRVLILRSSCTNREMK